MDDNTKQPNIKDTAEDQTPVVEQPVIEDQTPIETLTEETVQPVEETSTEAPQEEPVQSTEEIITEPSAEVPQEEQAQPDNETAEEVASEVAPEEDSTIEETKEEVPAADDTTQPADETQNVAAPDLPGRWYVVHTYSGHENRVATSLKQRVASEGLQNKIFDVLVPTQDKIEIRGGKKATVKEKIFPGYILVRMILDDDSWLAIRTTQGVTSFVGTLNKPTPIPNSEVQSIIKFMQQGGQPTYKDVIVEGDTLKIVDGPFADMIGKATEIDKEKGKVKVLVSIFGRETPVELDFLQVAKL